MHVRSQPALYVAGLAAVEKLRSEDTAAVEQCSAAAGLSLGEYCALVFAGALSFEDGLKVGCRDGCLHFALHCAKRASTLAQEKGTVPCIWHSKEVNCCPLVRTFLRPLASALPDAGRNCFTKGICRRNHFSRGISITPMAVSSHPPNCPPPPPPRG